MKKRSTLARLMDFIYIRAKITKNVIWDTREMKQRVKILNGGYRGSRKEFAKVKAYWKKYGVRPQKFWYQVYGDRPQKFDPRCIPVSIWDSKIVPYYNNFLFRRAYADKCMLDRLLPGVKQPETVVKNIAGYYYNGENQIITMEDAVELCAREEALIIKPSVDSGRGRLIRFYDRDKMNADDLRNIFKEERSNFILQRIIKQHPDLAAIHAASANTVRIMTFHFQGEVHILSAQLRMGAGDARIDNYSAGGIACSIKDDGWLEDEAVTRQYTWTDKHPSGRAFNTIRVPSYDKLKETVKRLHPLLPYYNLIGWDFAIDEEGDPVFIEFNVFPDQNEIGCKKPSFGDLTDAVLEDVFITKSLKALMP